MNKKDIRHGFSGIYELVTDISQHEGSFNPKSSHQSPASSEPLSSLTPSSEAKELYFMPPKKINAASGNINLLWQRVKWVLLIIGISFIVLVSITKNRDEITKDNQSDTSIARLPASVTSVANSVTTETKRPSINQVESVQQSPSISIDSYEPVELPELLLPENESIRTFTRRARVAPLEIKAATGSHFLIKLVDINTGSDVLTVFVRSGATVKIDVPLGSFEVRYASGEKWYGYDHLFGPSTLYSKANEVFEFTKINGYTISLYKVLNGNLSTSSIRSTDF